MAFLFRLSEEIIGSALAHRLGSNRLYEGGKRGQERGQEREGISHAPVRREARGAMRAKIYTKKGAFS